MDTFLVDSHCHLQYLKNNNDIDTIINEAEKNNVKLINNISASRKDFDEIINICNKYKNVFGSMGIHPSEIEDITIEELIKYTKNTKICSIGETGLDYHFLPFDKKQQLKNFEIHIEASRQTQLPLVIHSRDCDLDMIEVLENEIKNGYFPFLLHCFCSSKDLAYKALDLNAYISFSGVITFKNSKELQELAKAIPINKMLIETDSPYLAPVPLRGQQNKPAFVRYIAEFISELLNIDFNDFATITTNNFFKIFNKIPDLRNSL